MWKITRIVSSKLGGMMFAFKVVVMLILLANTGVCQVSKVAVEAIRTTGPVLTYSSESGRPEKNLMESTFILPATGVGLSSNFVGTVGDGFGTRQVGATFIKPNEKERMKVIVLVGDSKWESTWIDFDGEYDRFTFQTMYNGNIPLNLLEGYQLYIDSKTFAEFEPPEVVKSFIIESDFNNVWLSAVEALAEINIPIDQIDRESGLIITSEVSDPQGNTMVCPTFLDSKGLVKFNLLMREKKSGVKVTINTSFTALRSGERIQCYSNGNIESWLISKIIEISEE